MESNFITALQNGTHHTRTYSSSSHAYPVVPVSQVEDQEDHEENETNFRNLVNVLVAGGLLLFYSALGAWIFYNLEDEDDRAKTSEIRNTVALARIKLHYDVSHLNWTSCSVSKNEMPNTSPVSLAAFSSVLREYEAILNSITEGELTRYLNHTGNSKGRWNYFHSLLFVFTLVTTIGYGNLTPKTIYGRIFCVMFALVGIPLALIVIHLAGKLLAGVSISIFTKFIPKQGSSRSNGKSTRLQKLFGTTMSVFGVINILLCYNTLGAFLYNYTESWSFVNAFYFCFTTLTTVGFGDLVPQSGVASGNPFAFIRVIYILFGLALTSTAFELVRTQYSKTWSKKAKQISKTPTLFVTVKAITKQHQEEIVNNAGKSDLVDQQI